MYNQTGVIKCELKKSFLLIRSKLQEKITGLYPKEVINSNNNKEVSYENLHFAAEFSQ